MPDGNTLQPKSDRTLNIHKRQKNMSKITIYQCDKCRTDIDKRDMKRSWLKVCVSSFSGHGVPRKYEPLYLCSDCKAVVQEILATLCPARS
jgi:uncharacterized protein YlaI